MDLSLPIIPFLEVVSTMLLMSWVDFRKVHHFLLELHLSETLVYEQVVLLMHGSVAALARSTEYLETSSQCSGVEGVPCEVTWPVCMSVMHTDRVNLFFVTFDSVRSADVISEDPSLCRLRLANEVI
jgi:hypothetical protein